MKNRLMRLDPVILLMVIFWACLPWLGLPGAHVCDDVVFAAPAIDFATGHPMSCHILQQYCEAYGLNADRWLIHSPTYPELLGSWLWIFGISNGAMLAFQAAINVALFCGLAAIMRRFDIHSAWAIPPSVVLLIAELRGWGLRPEALGALLLLLGVLFIFRRNGLGAFLAGVFWIGAGAVLQQAAIYAGLFLLAAIADIAFAKESARQRLLRLTALFGGALIPVVCFLWGIGWDVRAFTHDFTLTLNIAAGMTQSRAHILADYFNFAVLGWEWAQLATMAVLVGVVLIGVIKAKDRLQRWLLAGVIVGLVINVWIVRAQAYRLSFLYVLIACCAFCILGAMDRRWLGLRFGLACISSLVALVLAAPGLCGNYLRLPGNADAVRKAVANQDCSAVYLDSYAAWDVFGWRLPGNAQSLQNSKRYSPLPALKGELFILQESEYQKVPLRLFGREFSSVNLNNRRWDVVDFAGKSLISGTQVGLPRDLTQR